VCQIAGFRSRPYDVFVPTSYGPDSAVPVVIALHGGGGKAENAITTTCPNGDRTSPSCLHNIAEGERFVVLFPNGSGFLPLVNLKTWNAGGGGEYNCASGRACQEDVDDIAYFNSLLDDLATWLNVDTGRVYFTGLSNGAAMSHRVACEMSARVTAIAAIAGTNQFSATAPCEPQAPVAVLQIHGTADPCWTYEASTDACLDDSGGIKIGVDESTLGWVDRLQCAAEPATDALPDVIADGTSTTRTTWSGCGGDVEVQLLRVEGGGHTWPAGEPGLPVRIVGPVNEDWDSALIWDFLSRFDRA